MLPMSQLINLLTHRLPKSYSISINVYYYLKTSKLF